MDQGSKGYAFEAGLRAVQDALVRRGINGHATHGAANGLYDVYYDIESEKLVSIIIPTKMAIKTYNVVFHRLLKKQPTKITRLLWLTMEVQIQNARIICRI